MNLFSTFLLTFLKMKLENSINLIVQVFAGDQQSKYITTFIASLYRAAWNRIKKYNFYTCADLLTTNFVVAEMGLLAFVAFLAYSSEVYDRSLKWSISWWKMASICDRKFVGRLKTLS